MIDIHIIEMTEDGERRGGCGLVVVKGAGGSREYLNDNGLNF